MKTVNYVGKVVYALIDHPKDELVWLGSPVDSEAEALKQAVAKDKELEKDGRIKFSVSAVKA